MGKLVFLKTDQDFAAFRASKSFTNTNQLLKIRVHLRNDQNTPRFGFIIPKKIVPKVVDRNLLKRRIKSILTKTHNTLKPVDIIFYPQKDLIKKKFSELEIDVKDLFSKARLWKS